MSLYLPPPIPVIVRPADSQTASGSWAGARLIAFGGATASGERCGGAGGAGTATVTAGGDAGTATVELGVALGIATAEAGRASGPKVIGSATFTQNLQPAWSALEACSDVCARREVIGHNGERAGARQISLDVDTDSNGPSVGMHSCCSSPFAR